MNMLYDIRNDVHRCGEDTQVCLQDLNYKVQLVINWYEHTAQVFHVPLPIFIEGMRPDIPILTLVAPLNSSQVDNAPPITNKVVQEEHLEPPLPR